VQCCAVLCSSAQFSSGHCGAVQYRAAKISAVWYSAVQCSAVQCSAVQCSAAQCSSVKHSVVQRSAEQCVQCEESRSFTWLWKAGYFRLVSLARYLLSSLLSSRPYLEILLTTQGQKGFLGVAWDFSTHYRYIEAGQDS
jgi:hypothetical protein